jgi:nucleotide-binding universal stress UspA family protein
MNKSPIAQAVVVGTDGSPSARSAVSWAAKEADRVQRPLHIVHVQLDTIRNAKGLAILEAGRTLAAEACPDLQITTELIHGPTNSSLREAADHASELVLGHRGAGKFVELLVGSTALRVAGHVRSTVVIVRGDHEGSHNEVLVGVDLDEPMDGPLNYAFEAARVRGATLRAIHAWLMTDDYTAALKGTRGYIDPLERLSALLRPWRQRFPEVKIAEEMVVDGPVAALTKASADADLVVVGSHGRSGVGAILLGSVGHGLLHHSRCPVAVITSQEETRSVISNRDQSPQGQ